MIPTKTHGSLGNNVKIHFAGIEEEHFFAATKAANVNYALYSCFKFIDKKDVSESFLLPSNHLIKELNNQYSHVIQDSGLFTLMFGAGKNRNVDHNYLVDWQDKLIKFVTQNQLSCTCVDIDCQKLLGPEEAWFFRKRMKERLPNRQINVFHFEDGKEGLDRLIDFSEYIAISVPELRIVKPKTYKKDAVALARYCKARKPTIDIHMLGCTEYSMLKDISFCTSADSTSWLSGVKFGWFNDGKQKGHIKHFREDLMAERKVEVEKRLLSRNVNLLEKTIWYSTRASLCASICKKRYMELVGSQE